MRGIDIVGVVLASLALLSVAWSLIWVRRYSKPLYLALAVCLYVIMTYIAIISHRGKGNASLAYGWCSIITGWSAAIIVLLSAKRRLGGGR